MPSSEKEILVQSRVAYAKERASLSQKLSICQQFFREHSYYLQLNFDVRKDGWMPQDGRHGVVGLTPHIDLRFLVNADTSLEDVSM